MAASRTPERLVRQHNVVRFRERDIERLIFRNGLVSEVRVVGGARG